MNLKELIRVVEKVKKDHQKLCKKKMYGDTGLTELEDMELRSFDGQLRGIKQTVEVVDVVIIYANYYNDYKYRKDWQKLKTLLELK